MDLNEIAEILKDNGFQIQINTEEMYSREFFELMPDIEIYFNNRLIGAIVDENRSSKINIKSKNSNKFTFLNSLIKIYKTILLLVEYDKIFLYFDTVSKNDDNDKNISNIDITLSHLFKIRNKYIIQNDKNLIAKEVIDDFFDSLIKYNKINYDNKFKNYSEKPNVDELYVFDESNKLIEDNSEKFSLSLLDFLIEPYTNQYGLHRYVSFEAVFETIKNQSYRICSINGMNDQTEGTLITEIINKVTNNNINFSNIGYTRNDIFISSFSSSFDDLTMWRLYGDNSKGAILTMKNKGVNRNYLLKKVSYLSDVFSPKIIRLFILIKELSLNEIKISPNIFKYILLFIKNKHYSVEREIRLLFINSNTQVQNDKFKKDWSIAMPFKIARPYFDIKILNNSDFPLVLNKITLGPNLPYKNLNKNQLKKLIEFSELTNINVELSEIASDLYIV